MRPTTKIYIALRNIGDSQDTGEVHHGTVNECVVWLATKFLTISIATRLVIGVGRNEDDALAGIQVKGAGKTAMNTDLLAALNTVMGDYDESQEETPHEPTISQLNPLSKQSKDDDYVA